MRTGTVMVRRPRVREVDERFESRLLPLFTRCTREVINLLPDLYLHGMASRDFEVALSGLLGEEAALSPSTPARAKNGGRPVQRVAAAPDRGRDRVPALDSVYLKAGLEKEGGVAGGYRSESAAELIDENWEQLATLLPAPARPLVTPANDQLDRVTGCGVPAAHRRGEAIQEGRERDRRGTEVVVGRRTQVPAPQLAQANAGRGRRAAVSPRPIDQRPTPKRPPPDLFTHLLRNLSAGDQTHDTRSWQLVAYPARYRIPYSALAIPGLNRPVILTTIWTPLRRPLSSIRYWTVADAGLCV